jgi:hypothetical protein
VAGFARASKAYMSSAATPIVHASVSLAAGPPVAEVEAELGVVAFMYCCRTEAHTRIDAAVSVSVDPSFLCLRVRLFSVLFCHSRRALPFLYQTLYGHVEGCLWLLSLHSGH